MSAVALNLSGVSISTASSCRDRMEHSGQFLRALFRPICPTMQGMSVCGFIFNVILQVSIS